MSIGHVIGGARRGLTGLRSLSRPPAPCRRARSRPRDRKAEAVSSPMTGGETHTKGSVFATKGSGNTRQRRCLRHKRQWRYKAKVAPLPQAPCCPPPSRLQCPYQSLRRASPLVYPCTRAAMSSRGLDSAARRVQRRSKERGEQGLSLSPALSPAVLES